MPVRVNLRYIEKWKASLEDAVLAYEAEPIIKDQIVFYGASNFTRWAAKWDNTPLREDLLGKSGAPCCINRGFGGSCPEHQLYYYSRLVRPLAPRVLVYAPGSSNGKNFGYTREECFELAQRVIHYALTDFPELRIYLLGNKKNLKIDEAEWEKRLEYNAWLKAFAEQTPRCFYLEAERYAPMQRDDIFVSDLVHYNQEGYALYRDFFKEALKEELDQY